jgi:lipopolysaccharide export system permease protein
MQACNSPRGIGHSFFNNGSSFLTEKEETLNMELKYIRRYEIELNKKLTISFACLVFFFIGAPLGAIIRKGGLGTPAVISILFFVIWYVLSLSGEKLAEANHLGTVAGMWASSYILFPIGVFLTYKASNDSVIMNIDTYLAFLKKINDYVYNKIISGTKKIRN